MSETWMVEILINFDLYKHIIHTLKQSIYNIFFSVNDKETKRFDSVQCLFKLNFQNYCEYKWTKTSFKI